MGSSTLIRRYTAVNIYLVYTRLTTEEKSSLRIFMWFIVEIESLFANCNTCRTVFVSTEVILQSYWLKHCETIKYIKIDLENIFVHIYVEGGDELDRMNL